MGKLHNVLSFKEFDNLNKLENKPGKIIEGYDYDDMNENWFSDKYDEYKSNRRSKEFAKVEREILNHPIKSKIYKKIQGTDKGDKYVQFYIDYPNNFPKWDYKAEEWIPTGVQSYNNTSLG